jgi:hypothetical protein
MNQGINELSEFVKGLNKPNMKIRTTSKAPTEDAGKPQWSMLPWKALEQVVRVFEYGASKKYKRDSWREGFSYSDIYDKLMRHLTQWWEGEDIDDESNLLTVAHIGWNALMLIHLVLFFPKNDNRPHKLKEEEKF